ncbi:MAG: hypothetical protein ACRCST_04355 [Turicibacter sp.]
MKKFDVVYIFFKKESDTLISQGFTFDEKTALDWKAPGWIVVKYNIDEEYELVV